MEGRDIRVASVKPQGALLTTVVGAIVTTNFVITVRIEGGHEASISDVFRQNFLGGIVAIAILVAGPILGAVFTRRQRDRHSTHHPIGCCCVRNR